MNKETYLNELAQALKLYDKAYVDEIISDYEAHFENGIRQGKSEADICRELGSVSDVIEEIKELLGENRLKGCPPARPDAPVEKSGDGYFYGYDRQNSEERQYESENGRQIHSFLFKAGSADMKLIPSPDNMLRVYTEDKEEMQYISQTINDGCYMGEVASKKQRFLGTMILVNMFGGPVEKVIVQIPASVENIEIEAKSGDISMRQLNAENISVHTLSGDIYIKNTQSRQMEINAISGDIELKKICAEVLKLQTTSGDVRYEDVVANEISLKTTSGDLGGRQLESRSVFVRAVSGDISLNMKCYDEKLYAYAHSISGSIKVKGGIRVAESDFTAMDMSSCMKAAVETVSGDIRIKAV